MDIAYSREALHALMALGLDDRLRAVTVVESLAADPHVESTSAWRPIVNDDDLAAAEPDPELFEEAPAEPEPEAEAAVETDDAADGEPAGDTVEASAAPADDDGGTEETPETEAEAEADGDEANEKPAPKKTAAASRRRRKKTEPAPEPVPEPEPAAEPAAPEIRVDPSLNLIPLTDGKGLYLLPFTATGDLVVSVEDGTIIVLALIDVLGGFQKAADQ